MPDTRSGKSKAGQGGKNSELIQIITSKFNELKQDLITEINQKVVKKQKEEFDVTILNLQEKVTTMEFEKDDLEHYGCVRDDEIKMLQHHSSFHEL